MLLLPLSATISRPRLPQFLRVHSTGNELVTRYWLCWRKCYVGAFHFSLSLAARFFLRLFLSWCVGFFLHSCFFACIFSGNSSYSSYTHSFSIVDGVVFFCYFLLLHLRDINQLIVQLNQPLNFALLAVRSLSTHI